jgi:uncharacterized cupredoxin-like copper-binding protein
MTRLTTLLGASFAVLAASSLALGHSSEVGRPGDPKKAKRTIEIGMHEGDGKMSYNHAEIRIKRGETVRFLVKNHGELDHELIIDTVAGNAKHKIEMEKNPDMEHDDPNAIRVKPKQDGTLVWQFTKKGIFEYACLIPGHYEAGMKGRIIVD